MRFHIKLFLALVTLTFVLWGGAFVVTGRSVDHSFDRLDNQTFAGIDRGLRRFYRDRASSLQQACKLVINIPDLRALIADQNFEFVLENQKSLQERLDHLNEVVGASFAFALIGSMSPIAQNEQSAWRSLDELADFLHSSPAACALLDRTVRSPHSSSVHGMWEFEGNLYQVAAAPLIFPSDDGVPRPEGLLVMGERITDDFASELGSIHNCQVTFLANDAVAASSLAEQVREELLVALPASDASASFVMNLGRQSYRTIRRPLVDPSSQEAIGVVVVQRSQEDLHAFKADVSGNLVLITLGGLVIGAILSYFLSLAITRPVNELARGVQSVGQGNLDLKLQIRSRDELGELASTFNNMVEHLRTSRQELQHAHDELEQRVMQRTFELSQANVDLCREVAERQRAEKKAAAASEAKSGFLANMSHEIRTPMSAILGFSEQLLDPSVSQDTRLQCVRTIQRNSQQLLDLINSILDLSKIEAGKLDVACTPCSPVQIVADVVSLMHIRAVTKGIDFQVEYDGIVPREISSDSTRLRQILVNFVGNAIKFTDDGSVRLRVKLLAGKRGSRNSETAALQFDVIDTGIGMTTEQLRRIFQPFTQADETTTRRFGGTGLGLTISKRLAELLGGGIRVVSEPDMGSTFTLIVPTGSLAGVEMIENPGELDDPEPDSNTSLPIQLAACRVLLAEDRVENQELVSFVLGRAGANVEIVDNGKAAVDRVLSASSAKGPAYDIILMDMQMPILDGYNSTRILRAKGCTIPIVALTAHAMQGDREKCIHAGCTDHITKPFDSATLLQTVARHVGDARQIASPRGNAEVVRAPGRVESNEVATNESSDIFGDCYQTAAAKAFDFDVLLRRCMGNRSFAASMIEKFHDRVESDIEKIGQALHADDAESLSQLAHGLKGAAAILSATRLSDVAASLETIGRDGTLAEGRQLLDRLQSEWDQCRTQIDAVAFEATC